MSFPADYQSTESPFSSVGSRFDAMKKSFYYYADKFQSNHFVYPHDEKFFDSQMRRPKITSDKNYYAYDPFLQAPGKRKPVEITTLSNHFYYEDTPKATEHKKQQQPKKLKIPKQTKGIVIKEKALSGEVSNPTKKTTSTTTTVTTSTILTTKTTSTTTLPPSSVSTLSPLGIIARLKDQNRYKLKYRLTGRPAGLTEAEPHRSYNHFTPYDFYKFMPPQFPPPTPAYSPARKVVMPPYTPAPSNTSRPAPAPTAPTVTPQYEAEEFFYSDNGESKTFEAQRTESEEAAAGELVSQPADSGLSAGRTAELDIQSNNAGSHGEGRHQGARHYDLGRVSGRTAPSDGGAALQYSYRVLSTGPPGPPGFRVRTGPALGPPHPADYLHIFTNARAANSYTTPPPRPLLAYPPHYTAAAPLFSPVYPPPLNRGLPFSVLPSSQPTSSVSRPAVLTLPGPSPAPPASYAAHPLKYQSSIRNSSNTTSVHCER